MWLTFFYGMKEVTDMNRESFEPTVKCELTITTSARNGIEKIVPSERAFFAMQKSFVVHIEKRPESYHGSQSFTFFFDPEANNKLSDRLEGRVAVMECVVKNDGFLATGFHVRGKREPAATNRRLKATVTFKVGSSKGLALPIDFATLLRELPIAEERSEYVKKRIGGWEGYLGIMEKNADVEDLHGHVRSITLSEDFKLASIKIEGISAKAWRSLPGFSAKFQNASFDLGNILTTNQKKGLIDIELKPPAIQQARKTGFLGKDFESMIFSNFAELSQVRRLRKGFKDLQDGLAANGNLEKILFEERPVVQITKGRKPLEFAASLNEFQQEAVTGAMSSSDVYVVQGPPGTGKTTVISEICNQAVKAGMRTLIASQANLAVDNALGRLLHNPDIRILRYGRTESIEEEGRKYIEENVAEHWRQQTLLTMEEELRQHSILEESLRKQMFDLQEKDTDLRTEREKLNEKQQVWNEQKRKHQELERVIKERERERQHVQLEIDKVTGMMRAADQQYVKLQDEIGRIEEQLSQLPKDNRTVQEVESERSHLEKRIHLLKTTRSVAAITEQIRKLQTSIEQTKERLTFLEQVIERIAIIHKLNDLKDLMDSADFVPTSSLEKKMTQLIRQIDRIQEVGGEDSFSAWSDTNVRVNKAITMVTNTLKDHHFHNRIQIPKGFRNRHSLQSIQETVSRVGRYIMQPDVQKILSTTTFSVEAYDCLENLTKAVDLLHDRKNFITAFLIEAKGTTTLFEDIKQTVRDMFLEEYKTLEITQQKDQLQLNEVSSQLSEIQQFNNQIDTPEAIDSLLADSESGLAALTKTLETLNHAKKIQHTTEQELVDVQKKMDNLLIERVEYKAKEANLELQYNEMEVTIHTEKEQMKLLAKTLEENPADRLTVIATEQQQVAEQIEQVEKKSKHVPMIQSLQQTWYKMLTEASSYDLDEIRKMYVKHANVIGTTCVASARKEFAEDYPMFDLVIIDEVSKATPPELLLPMLKGKKIVLVGDHHQLPPLVGQETMEEFLEEMPDDDQKREMEKLLKESLFERLFRTLPKQNKTMLGIQYRMHKDIMNTITPFYNENGYELTCGLPNSDIDRAHHLSSSLITKNSHLLWLDQPNVPAYYEAQLKGGTSRYNESELNSIRTLLKELDEATASAIRSGELPPNSKKQIGVISFYGEQVKRINQLVYDDVSTEHLTFRTGSVDKFQGMEMDVIIVSFVRNHGNKSGDIGFAKDYRRLNVALSRARELLIVVGSSEMFMNNPKSKETRTMYAQLYKTIKSQNGIRSLAEPIGQ